MLTQSLSVKDQFGIKHLIEATVEPEFTSTGSYSHIKHITIDGEDIRPSFEMFFQSNLSGKIYKIL